MAAAGWRRRWFRCGVALTRLPAFSFVAALIAELLWHLQDLVFWLGGHGLAGVHGRMSRSSFRKTVSSGHTLRPLATRWLEAKDQGCPASTVVRYCDTGQILRHAQTDPILCSIYCVCIWKICEPETFFVSASTLCGPGSQLRISPVRHRSSSDSPKLTVSALALTTKLRLDVDPSIQGPLTTS